MARATPKYQLEPTDLRDEIWSQGHIKPWQLLRVCAWKSAKGLAPLSLNSETEIIERTRAACDAVLWARDLDVMVDDVPWDRWEESVKLAVGSERAGSGLLGLDGVGYPVATAILCILNPKAFPVLDRWAIVGLFGSGGGRPQSYYRGTKYREYTQRLLEGRQTSDATTVHGLDLEAMRRGMAKQI